MENITLELKLDMNNQLNQLMKLCIKENNITFTHKVKKEFNIHSVVEAFMYNNTATQYELFWEETQIACQIVMIDNNTSVNFTLKNELCINIKDIFVNNLLEIYKLIQSVKSGTYSDSSDKLSVEEKCNKIVNFTAIDISLKFKFTAIVSQKLKDMQYKNLLDEL